MVELPPGTPVNGVIDFKCPFCGGAAFAAEDPMAVGHLEPPCSTFLAMEPTEFLRAVNQATRQQN